MPGTAYALPMRCPVLPTRFICDARYSLPACSAMPGTGVAYGAALPAGLLCDVRVRRYAEPPYGAMERGVLSAGTGQVRVRDVWYCAMCGTELAYGPLRCGRYGFAMEAGEQHRAALRSRSNRTLSSYAYVLGSMTYDAT
eukprot:592273-Rhodomonas_salina.1